MIIAIEYESRYCNSFLDGDNNEPLPKGGRAYCASSTSLKNRDVIKRDITQDTVMGVLSRLIGDYRKLYQARQSENYYFKDLEAQQKISFRDEKTRENEELVYLRNKSNNNDPVAFSGIPNNDHPILTSEISDELWSTLFMTPEQLLIAITSDFEASSPNSRNEHFSAIEISERSKEIGAIKNYECTPDWEAAYSKLKEKCPDLKNVITEKKTKSLIKLLPMYCSSLYYRLEIMKQKGIDITPVLEKSGALKGFSKNNITIKDFMSKFATPKRVWGNPYTKTSLESGVGKTKETLRVASGTLYITIDVDIERAKQIKTLIENAAVSTFYLGKKGSAYITDISLMG